MVVLASIVSLEDPREGLGEDNLRPDHQVLMSVKGWGQAAFEGWRRLYIEKEDAEAVLNSRSRDSAGGSNAATDMRDDLAQLRNVSRYEELERGLPDVY